METLQKFAESSVTMVVELQLFVVETIVTELKKRGGGGQRGAS